MLYYQQHKTAFMYILYDVIGNPIKLNKDTKHYRRGYIIGKQTILGIQEISLTQFGTKFLEFYCYCNFWKFANLIMKIEQL